MLALLLIISQVLGSEQIASFQEYTYPTPSISSNSDLVIELKKSANSDSLLFLCSIFQSPSFSYDPIAKSWGVYADYFDFQGWISNGSVLILRIPFVVISQPKNLFLGVYKQSSNIISYSIQSYTILSTSCLYNCENGVCVNGACQCSNPLSLGNDCSITPIQLSTSNSLTINIQGGSWLFYQVTYNLQSILNVDFENDDQNVFIYDTRSNSPQVLPSMLYWTYEYTFGENTQLSLQILPSTLKYWIWGIYCYSPTFCTLQISFNNNSSGSQSFIYIIISSIISLVLVCIATPIIIRLIIRSRERNRAKIGHSEEEAKKERLRKAFPETKFDGTGNTNNCIICLEEFQIGVPIRKLACDHVFHDRCIDEWCTTNTKCPLCKRDMFEKQQLDVSDLEN